MSNSWIDSGDGTGIFCDSDADNNLLQLKLKKPKAWKWELTTSRSSSSIAMPRIILFNHKGDMLVDANQQVDDAVYKMEKKPSRRSGKKLLRAVTANLERSPQDDEDTGLGSLDSADKHAYKPQRWRPNMMTDGEVSRTMRMGEKQSNAYKEWRHSFPDEIDFRSLQICEAADSDRASQKSPSIEDVNIDSNWSRKCSLKDKSIEPLKNNSSYDEQHLSKTSCKPFHSIGHLDNHAHEARPLERRASSFKEVRFNVHPPSGDEDIKPRDKRRYRRSNTSRSTTSSSGSILERLSAMKGRFSSPEFELAGIQQVQMAPRYFLRTSRAGTLVIAEEFPNKQRRARRRLAKTSSAENFLSPSSSSTKKNNSFNDVGLLGASLGVPCSQSQSMKSFAEEKERGQRRKVIPIRRNKSDGNILLATSSDEEDHRLRSEHNGRFRRRKNGFWRHNQGDAKTQVNLGG